VTQSALHCTALPCTALQSTYVYSGSYYLAPFSRFKYRYRSINTESNAFKSKLAPLVGPVLLLKALGFVKNEEEGKFVLDG
jgi:PUB domain